MAPLTPNPSSKSRPVLNTDLTEVSQATLKSALDAQTERLDFTIRSALNQRRQIALAGLLSGSKHRWRLIYFGKKALPAALACAALALVLTLTLPSAQYAASDADAALLADFGGANSLIIDSTLPDDSILSLKDDELALLDELEFYAWLDQQSGI